MHHSPDVEPMKRRQRFDFDAFDREISEALEESVGHMMLHGALKADGAMEILDAYEHTKILPAGALGEESLQQSS